MNRFWSKVDIKGPDDCWEWQASKKQTGYGAFSFNGKNWGAHRFSYFLEHGEFDQTLDVCHTCDNPPCVNPKHLWLGTASDNLSDMGRKGRHRMQKLTVTHCFQGHEYTEENTGRRPNSGNKYCKHCKAVRAAIWFRKNRSKNIRKRISKYEELNV